MVGFLNAYVSDALLLHHHFHNVYTHTSSESDRRASVAIERAIFGDLLLIVPSSENRNNSSDLEQGREFPTRKEKRQLIQLPSNCGGRI